MQDNTFDILEKKVLDAVHRIKELKQDNESLVNQKNQLEAQITDLKSENDRVQRALDETRTQAAQVVQMEDKRRLIEEKVGDLLEKLDTIE
jgi:FtsZ-binding cell division protein ZapB